MTTTFRKTRSAIAYISGSTRSDITTAKALALAAVLEEAEGTDVPEDAEALLRSVIGAARELVGAPWLAANTDDPDVGEFEALGAASDLPGAGVLDEIVSRVLWARFGPDAAGG